jgi:hypothetical protein
MAEASVEDLLARIEALEQRAAQQDVLIDRLRAQLDAPPRLPFRIVDEQGNSVLEVVRSKAGMRLRLLDGGRFLITLASVASGGSVVVHDSEGREVVGLAAGHHGGTVGVNDSVGKLAAWINVTESGAHVVTRDHQGRVTGQMPDAREASPENAQAQEPDSEHSIE